MFKIKNNGSSKRNSNIFRSSCLDRGVVELIKMLLQHLLAFVFLTFRNR